MTTSLEDPTTEDRFARRQRWWTGVPGAPVAAPENGTVDDKLAEQEARRTEVGEHLSTKLKGTFFPHAIFQTTCVVLIVFAVLLILVQVMHPTVGAPADPLNKERYLPRPAWYFYFLFQLLEMLQGQIGVVIGTFILPNIALIALILLPFYDRNPARKILKRPLAIVFFYGSMLFILVTTIMNLAGAPTQPTTDDQNHAPAPGSFSEAAPTFTFE